MCSFKKYFENFVLMEMPKQIDEINFEDDPNKVFSNWMNPYEKIGEFRAGKDILDVYVHDSLKHTDIKNYNINLKNKTIGSYSGREYKNGIITDVVKSFGKTYQVKGLMYYFYINFLLKRYAFIISDDSLTEAGFKFWKINFNNFISNGLKIEIVKFNRAKNELEVVGNITQEEELNDYYGDASSNPNAVNYRFRLIK